jgi:glycosyltransferase involved in cell wall biosynthesis
MNMSVCIAATRLDTAGPSVRSIVSQTARDWKLVVAKGNATDSAIVNEPLSGRHGKLVRDGGRGVSRARNAAVAAAEADMIAIAPWRVADAPAA